MPRFRVERGTFTRIAPTLPSRRTTKTGRSISFDDMLGDGLIRFEQGDQDGQYTDVEELDEEEAE